ncbi:MAG: DUF4595 domain-containing protein [Bacteroides sp.]|nr:DUF4595 domain-containing protein [Bacteroides sp.]
MKYKLHFLLLLAISMLAACSDDDNTEEKHSITITENVVSDGGNVYKEEIFLYSGSRLITHTTTQKYYEEALSYTIRFSYSGNQAIMTDEEGGNTATYTIGSNGYADKCTYLMGSLVREYTFSYEDDYLTQIDEKIDGTPYSSIRLQYDAGDLYAIENYGQTTLCQTGNDLNTCKLPCLLFSDLYPLSLHMDAVYAHLLGAQSRHLVTQTGVKDNDEERTTYAYQLDADNKPTQIDVATTYTGIVVDRYGNSSTVTSTNRRTLNVAIE